MSWSTVTVEGSCVWFAHSVPARPGRRGWKHHGLPALCLLLLLCQLHCQPSPLEWRFLLEAFKQYVPTQWPHTHTHTHTQSNIWYYGWSSDVEFSIFSSAASSWIQVNLGQTRKVTGIVIQGCPQYDYWVTKFKLQHSMDGLSWTDYTADGEVSEQRRPHATFQHHSKVTAVPLLNHMVRLINGLWLEGNACEVSKSLLTFNTWSQGWRIYLISWKSLIKEIF